MSWNKGQRTLPKQATGQYMRIQDGTNKFRVLSEPITGYEAWSDKKPIRRKEYDFKDVEFDINTYTGRPQEPKVFWAFVVWNYNEEQVQILSLDKSSILLDFETYLDDEDWGNPMQYDLKIEKTGKGMETRYKLIASNKKETSSEIIKEYSDMYINLDKLFEGGDPFEENKEAF